MFFLVILSRLRCLQTVVSIGCGIVGSTAGSVVSDVESDDASLEISRGGEMFRVSGMLSGTKMGACALSGGWLMMFPCEGMSSEKPKAGLSRDKLIFWFTPLLIRLALIG